MLYATITLDIIVSPFNFSWRKFIHICMALFLHNVMQMLTFRKKEKENEKQGEDGGVPAPSRCEYELQRAENVKNLAI